MDSVRLMKRLAGGDSEAATALYDRYGKAVFTVCLRSLGDRILAEEATQQTFLSAWRAAGSFEIGREPAPWLYSIARRAAVDVYRRERRHRADRIDRLTDPEIVALPPSFEGMWEAWQVRCAVDQLSQEERDVIQSTFYLGFTHEETAARLGVPVGTVKSRAHRAYRRLAAMLSHLGEATA
ncbi:MAG: RNA polymerase sigma factor [Actinomycetota bacterium]